MTTIVAMDTNALMMPVELDVRVFDELERLLPDFECVTPRAVLSELESLAADGNGRAATAARVGVDLATEHCTVADHEESYADDAVIELAGERAFDYVVTNDIPLKERVLSAGIPVIHLRGQNKLTITQP